MLLRKLGIISGLASGLVLAMSFGGVVADSSKPDVSFGEAITEADIAAWDIDIETPTGKGLPAGTHSVLPVMVQTQRAVRNTVPWSVVSAPL